MSSIVKIKVTFLSALLVNAWPFGAHPIYPTGFTLHPCLLWSPSLETVLCKMSQMGFWSFGYSLDLANEVYEQENGYERKERWRRVLWLPLCPTATWQWPCSSLQYLSSCGGPLLWLHLSLGFHNCPFSLPTRWGLKHLLLLRFIQMEQRTKEWKITSLLSL